MSANTIDVYLDKSGSPIKTDIIKPGQNKIYRINGAPIIMQNTQYYNVYCEFTDTGSGGQKKKAVQGYVRKSVFDALNVQTVNIPANFAGLEADAVPTRLMDQLFRIVEVVEDEDCVTVTARHVWYDNLENYTLWKPTEDAEYTAAAVCRNILTNAISPSPSHVASDCTDKKVGKDLDFERKNLVESFLDPEKGVCKTFGLSMIRDNWDFYCLKEVGYDRGMVIQNGKNLLGVERKESIENLATRVAPIGKDNKGEIVWLNNNGKKYIDSQYIGDYSYPRTEIYDTGIQIGKDGVTAQNINDKLLAAGQKRFTEDKVDLPEVEMTIEFLSLGDTEEYVQYRDLDKVYLYDILTIKDTVRGYSYSAQVVGVEHDILTGMLLSVTIGSITNDDGSRKIATWQVPEVSGENIRLKTIMAGAFEAGAIQTDDIGESVISYAHFTQATIDQLTTDALDAAYANIHTLIAGRITADDISAGAITTEKLDAGAVTAAKIDAGAITTDKLDAGAVTAAKISADDLTAIQAKLQIAQIANAQIASADIGYAQVKELNAQSAYFGQAVIQAGLANKLFVPRLAVGYAQMIGATIGDLVIQASNGNYYAIDVDLDGNVTATQRTVTAAEIASGHTTDGRQLVLGTDILAENLNTSDLTASHALMYSVTANIIDVDQLWARQAFINKLMVQDISSNTYIQSTIGNWTSSSTITQTINGLDSRISSLGYGTVYMQPEEPDHNHLTSGDIWIQTLATGTWQDIYDNHATWQVIYNDYTSWQVIGSVPQMWVWDGIAFQLMYDAYLPDELTTEIQQLADQITLLATKTQVDALSGEVTEFAATLAIQAEQIEAAVSAVNTKASTYVMYADPRTVYTVTLGDIWVKQAPHTQTWQDIYDSYSTWNELYSTFDAWKEFIGDESYVWDGSKWVMTSDRAEEIMQRTDITQTATAVTILAETTATLQGDQVRLSSQLTIANDRISAEVERATTAEIGKLDKTTQFQTADQIYQEAVSQAASSASGLYLAKTVSYQTADSIVSEAVRQSAVSAASSYIAKTSTYQNANSIVTEAVRQAGVSAAGTYIAKTSTYQDAASIVSAAEGYTNGQLASYSTTTQTATQIANYVTNNAYNKVSGITITASGVDISGSQYVKIASGGYLQVKTGNFGIDTNNANYVMWSGASAAADSYFRVKKNGEVTVTKLMVLNEQGTESEFNLRSGGLWKLSYKTVKSTSSSGGYCTGMTFSDGSTVNFNSAASVTLSGSWSGSTFTVTNSGNNRTQTASVEFDPAVSSFATQLFSNTNHTATLAVKDSDRGDTVLTATFNATDLYNAVLNSVAVDSFRFSSGRSYADLTNGSTYSASLPDATNWNLTNSAEHYATVTLNVGGKVYSQSFYRSWINGN